MADFEYVTALGVIVPDTADQLADVTGEWVEAFGSDLVTDPATPQGVMIAMETEARDRVARNNADLANQINPDLAGGVFLDAIWALTRGARKPATRSTIAGAVLSGQAGTLVPGGSLAAVTGSGALFQTVTSVTIGAGGTVSADLQSVDFGPIAAAAGQLVTVATSVLGWEQITNPNAAALGTLEESDISARRRRSVTLALQGVALPEAISSHLYALPTVKSLIFRENVTSAPAVIDGVLLKPHSVYVVVDGGTDQEVAESLLATKSLGADWNGATTVNVIEPSSGQDYDVTFDRPVEVPTWARITAKFNGLDGTSIIKGAVVAYADGLLNGDAGFVVGASVSPFELAGAVNQVEPRIFVTLVELSTDGITYAQASIPITIQQVARISAGTVTVVQV